MSRLASGDRQQPQPLVLRPLAVAMPRDLTRRRPPSAVRIGTPSAITGTSVPSARTRMVS